MRIIHLREQEKTGIGGFIKRTGLNLLYCSNCPKPLNHAYGRLQMSLLHTRTTKEKISCIHAVETGLSLRIQRFHIVENVDEQRNLD